MGTRDVEVRMMEQRYDGEELHSVLVILEQKGFLIHEDGD